MRGLDHLGDRLQRADLVVGPHHRDQGHAARVALDGGPQRADVEAAARGRPAAARRSAPSCSASQCSASSTAWCSTAEDRIRVRRGSASRRAQNSPLTARLSDSVPPEVKTTSPGRAPSARGDASRGTPRRRGARPGPARAGRRRCRPGELLGHRRDRLGEHRRGGRVVEVDGGAGGLGHGASQGTACGPGAPTRGGQPGPSASSLACHGWSGWVRRSASRSQARRSSASSGQAASRSTRSLARSSFALVSSCTAGSR